MDAVSNAIGIDRVNMDGKLILIEERHDSSANFLLTCVISNAVKNNYGICLVLFHDTFNHYHNTGMKFGYNLTLLKEKGKVTVVEPMKVVASNVECSREKPSTDILRDILVTIETEYRSVAKNNQPAIIVSDDLSHLCSFGCDLRQCVYYARCLTSLVQRSDAAQLCVLTHTYKIESPDSLSNTLARCLARMAQLFLKTEPLETGYSSHASGNLTVNWRIDAVRAKYSWPELSRYMYKLTDRRVQIYAPGGSA